MYAPSYFVSDSSDSLADQDKEKVITKLTMDYMTHARWAWLHASVSLLFLYVLEYVDTAH